ncbi:MAG TPA: phosphatase PAP2 family protein [Thermoanaerobaculia bacterium]|nr:phosphatase PAP2 family protein [Thermoanaerobaculia bacterium]
MHDNSVNPRRLMKWTLFLSLLTIFAVLFIDRPVARMLAGSAREMQIATGPAVHMIEVAFGFPISKFLTGAVLLAAAVALFPFRRFRSAAWLLMLFALAQLTTRLIAGVLKNVSLRPRPYEGLESHSWDFFTAGSSFPSGHAAHFWPFFFVAVVAFPRLRLPFFIVAAAVSIARVVVNDHFVGDVVASAAIAAAVSYAYARWLLPKITRNDGVTLGMAE